MCSLGTWVSPAHMFVTDPCTWCLHAHVILISSLEMCTYILSSFQARMYIGVLALPLEKTMLSFEYFVLALSFPPLAQNFQIKPVITAKKIIRVSILLNDISHFKLTTTFTYKWLMYYSLTDMSAINISNIKPVVYPTLVIVGINSFKRADDSDRSFLIFHFKRIPSSWKHLSPAIIC